ncbi:MAG: type II/IV secretion system protein [Sedimentisphaerales bacterium]|nr:type II/IV secretion system protein [Sedimentisphaerales bacterium]
MENNDPIISILYKEIEDKQLVKETIEKHKKTGKSLLSILKEGNFLNEEQTAKIVAAGNSIEFINLSPDDIDPIAAHLVTSQIAGQYVLIPIKKVDNKLYVAMSDPLNLIVRDQIELRTGLKVVPLAASPAAVRSAIRYHFNVRNATRQAIASMRLKQSSSEEGSKEAILESKSFHVGEDPVTNLAHSIVIGAIEARASDIHIEPREPEMRVRYRVDGLLRDAIEVPASVQQEVISHIKILSEMDISERRMPQDGHIPISHEGRDYDLRVSSLPAVGGEKIVIRILDKNMDRWSLDKIVPSEDNNRKFRSLLNNPYGMILLTGPTGSGKTTSLYALLQLLNTPEKNIVTVEDPVEYRLDGITQVQVNNAAGRSFAKSLRSILRQDPDIVLIGEIRDYETAEIAVSAALTGHLVLSTLHTNDAAGAISRLTNIGVPPFLIASALLGAVAQRLVRTICPKCKKMREASPGELEILSNPSLAGTSKKNKTQIYSGSGCDACSNSGYSGRKALYEILSVTGEIRQHIVNLKSDGDIKQEAIKQGMKTLREDGIEMVLSGQTTLDEINRVVDMRSK